MRFEQLYCIDCKKKLPKSSCYGIIRNNKIPRCASCAKKGKLNPFYKHGKWNNIFCIDCGKQLINCTAKRCHSCENKRRHKKEIFNLKGRNNHFFGKIFHGKWGKYKNIWMRSSWETKYAQYLDKNKIRWQYEPIHFDLGNSTYTPDFYLIKENKYIEIKGYWRDDAKKKFKKFKRLYPKIKLNVLERKHLKKLEVL